MVKNKRNFFLEWVNASAANGNNKSSKSKKDFSNVMQKTSDQLKKNSVGRNVRSVLGAATHLNTSNAIQKRPKTGNAHDPTGKKHVTAKMVESNGANCKIDIGNSSSVVIHGSSLPSSSSSSLPWGSPSRPSPPTSPRSPRSDEETSYTGRTQEYDFEYLFQ